jgi:hypothetical protein
VISQARCPAQQAGNADLEQDFSEQGVMNKAETMSEEPWGQPQVYEIRFEGHLSSYRAQAFEGLQMVQGPDGETVLTGPVIDQAALHGILSRIRDLGVPLLSVKRLTQAESSTESRAPR